MSTYEFHVEMTCSGCSNAVNRILLKKLGENAKFDIDLDGKKVTIESDVSQEQLMEYLKKSGKAVEFLGVK